MDDLFGRDLFGNPIRPPSSGPVAARFTFAPFTTLDARSGEWQERKRAWISLGIESETGRDDSIVPNGTHRPPEHDGCYMRSAGSGASIFDPVLCELVYRWWSPPSGVVLDPFAGGSVRGIVAGCLGRRYWGGELRPEQVEANRAQADAIRPKIAPSWTCGDSRLTLGDAPEADLVFSCPPYGDLEVYSDDPSDLSAMDWGDFLTAYRAIIAAACSRLHQDRFACFVVGDFRDGRGCYRNFVGETIAAFLGAGLDLYNEAILLTSVGSAAMRVSKQFAAGRKLCKVHQNVLVFVKGNPARAARACGDL